MKTKAEVAETPNSTHYSALCDLFYYTNLQVGICTSSAAAAAYYINNVKQNLSCLCFIFCSTIFIYNLERLNPSSADKLNCPKRNSWINDNKNLLVNTNILLISICIYLLIISFSLTLLITSCFLLLASLCYNSKLKKIPAMKNIMVSTIWAVTVSILPLIWANESLHKINISYTLICLGCAFINTIIFDMRDFTGDLESGVKSIPVILSKGLCYVLCLLIGLSIALLSIYNDMAILVLIPTVFAVLIKVDESRLKYLLADIILATPLLILI